ncbi:interferon lambda-4-like [Heterocephalus glaber]|uniref:Interferon lambda-4-like n=1 Tax=Heterocephalus glaber TaxID=10181 RepID=A0AAX6RHE3_HETGA|nr:interferon lambda-4-like [Heterocephalus glaber]
MQPSGRAAVAAGLWVMCMLVMAENLRVAEDRGMVAPRHCLLSHYHSLEPRALAAVKALRDSYEEERPSWRPRNYSVRAPKDPPRPSSCAGLRRVARSIADAQAVLSSLRSPERFPGTGPTLELLAAAGGDVEACLQLIRPGSWRRSPRPTAKEATQAAKGAECHAGAQARADSPRCHETTVFFNLLRLLTRDRRLVATSGPCI